MVQYQLIAGIDSKAAFPLFINCYMTPNGDRDIIENHQAIGYTWVYTTDYVYNNYPKEYSLVTDKNGVLNLFVLSQKMDNNNIVMLQSQFDGSNWLSTREISTDLGSEGSGIENVMLNKNTPCNR